MSTTTTNFGLIQPAVNDPTSQDTWGGDLNTDLSSVDSLLLTAMNFVASVKTSSFSVTAPTSASSTTGSSKILFRCNANSGSQTASLPSALSAGSGFTVAFKKTDSSANAVIINPAGADKIDGASSFSMSTQYNWAIIVSDGISAWDILSDTPSTQTIADKTISSNISGSTGAPAGNTLTALLDNIIGSTRGAIIYRGASAWTKVDPGTINYVLTSNGPGADPTYKVIPSSIPSALGVGSTILATQSTGGTIAAGATTAAANLTPVRLVSGGTFVGTSDSISGTWQALQSMGVSPTEAGLWLRTV